MITGLFPAALTIAFKSYIPSTRPKPISKGGRGDNRKDKLRRRFSNLERQTLKENNNQITTRRCGPSSPCISLGF
jgi:hypothetical protein